MLAVVVSCGVEMDGSGGEIQVRINLLTSPGMHPTSITVSPGRNTLYIFWILRSDTRSSLEGSYANVGGRRVVVVEEGSSLLSANMWLILLSWVIPLEP